MTRVIIETTMCGNFLIISCLLWNVFNPVSTLDSPFSNIIFSASTSSYQVEGAWNVDGKGENVWDRLTHTHPETVNRGQNGDDTDKSYYFYKNDSDLLKEIGFNMYRFSISWARILPNGDSSSEINQAGIQHYKEVIDDLLEKNIEPMVTIYHWDLPQKLQDVGGWLNSSIVDHMENYADILFSNYGDRVKWWITLNEPYFVVMFSQNYFNKDTGAPPLDSKDSSDYIMTHNLLLAHMRIYRLYERKYKSQQKGKVSISLIYDNCFPKTKSQEDIDATERHHQFSLGIFAHPIYSKEGDYPELVREIVNNNSKKEGLLQSRLPAFTEEEISNLTGSSDFFSLNHYTSLFCTSAYQNDTTVLPYSKDINTHEEPITTQDPETKTGFKETLSRISKEYNNPEIFITENGYEDAGELNDTSRIEYFRNYLTQLLEASNNGSKIIGYTVWSLLDNFEWLRGYDPRFGIVYVDYNSTNKQRTRKQSSYFFQRLIETKTIPVGNV